MYNKSNAVGYWWYLLFWITRLLNSVKIFYIFCACTRNIIELNCSIKCLEWLNEPFLLCFWWLWYIRYYRMYHEKSVSGIFLQPKLLIPIIIIEVIYSGYLYYVLTTCALFILNMFMFQILLAINYYIIIWNIISLSLLL